MKKLNWGNLKAYKCPECEHALKQNTDITMHFCSWCEFRITDLKFKSIVMSKFNTQRYTPRDETDENQRQLNNL